MFSCLDCWLYIKDTQLAHLIEAGFKKENVSTEVIWNQPPGDCEYYSKPEMIAPTVVK